MEGERASHGGSRCVGPRLLLAPASERGWFGGQVVEATEALDVRAGVPLAEAAEALSREFTGSGAGLTAVLASYDGACVVARFARWREPESLPIPAGVTSAALLRDAAWDLSPRAYRTAVASVRERIAAGDVYVLNLTARLMGTLALDTPEATFAALNKRAKADMAALFEGLPGPAPWIASVSPERFVRVRRDGATTEAARFVEVSPIKGTRPRGASVDADAKLAADLAADVKERAEHIMVVDLERNDLGVVCVPGSVHVEPVYEVVTTPYCHQLVSTVRGTLRPDASFAELLQATFPCGSVTGAPKIAAMRIAAELEAGPRGAYCGALLVAVRGELDSSVLIRTLEAVAEHPARARYGAGCGLTSDSDPVAEHLEALLKASLVTGDGAPSVALRETMRASRGRVPLLDLHLARLSRGGAGPSVLARVRDAVDAALAEAGGGASCARLGVTVTPDGSVAAGVTNEPSTLWVEGGPRLAPVEVAEAPVLPPGAAKPASRLLWDRAHRAARAAGADQAVLHTSDGVLIDGSTATVWLVRDGCLLTPPAPPAVAGVCREVVFDAAAASGVSVCETGLTLIDLEDADEVWLSNAHGGFVPGRGRGGPVGEGIAREVELALGGPPGLSQ